MVEKGELDPWMLRIEQLVLSDPVEILSFVSDALIAVAAQLDDKENAWQETFDVLYHACDQPELEKVIEIVRRRYQQLLAVTTEQTGASTDMALRAFYRATREAPWPDE